jgi:GH25 family lysozyme M1 (1,4-beta-N-acetylmuramidase)
MTDKGLDFSHYQGQIDWPAVKAAGLSFAIGKTTEASSPDPTWATNRANALAAGVKVAGYHWAHPNTDPVASAHAFSAALQQVDGMLPAFIDVEHNGSPDGPSGAGGQSPQHIHDWIHTFADTYGKPIGIYTGSWFWDPFVAPAAAGCARCAAMPLWLSRYASSMGEIPQPWSKVAIWQYTDSGHVPGIGGAVDLDSFQSESLADLLAFANGTAATTPGTTPPPPLTEELPVDQETFNTLMDNWAKRPQAFPAKSYPGSITERVAARFSEVFRRDYVNLVEPFQTESIAQRSALVVGTDVSKPYNLNQIRYMVARLFQKAGLK